MMIPPALAALFLLQISILALFNCQSFLRLPSEAHRLFRAESDGDLVGTRWAILLAGSTGYWNYRHQADVCHAYQTLKRGGLKDENIIVFMYDDIAHNVEDPRPGVIINSPHGEDVYKGVPKDYVGDDVTVNNFFAVLLGNRTAVKGGSGKVINSGPDDHIFIFYSAYGGPGVLGMPTDPYLYATDLVDVLKKKHASGTYKSLVFYLDACESGSIFEGLLPPGLNIYATTASSPEEISCWGTYCPGDNPSHPPEYETCLGNLYSVAAWLEDSDMHNIRSETLRQQYHLVRTGTNPANDNFTFAMARGNILHRASSLKGVNQHDADLLHLLDKFCKEAPEESSRKFDAQKQLAEAIAHRTHVDSSIKQIGQLLFGNEKGPEVLKVVRPPGKPLVDDWTCLKSLVKTFETYCGSLSYYGLKHMRAIANICNEGVTKEQMAEVSAQACPTFPSDPWSSLQRGFTTLNRPANDNFNIARVDSLNPVSFSNCYSQDDVELLYFWEMLLAAPEGSSRKFDVQKEFGEVLAYRVHVHSSIKLIGQLLFGIEKGLEVLKAVQRAGKPLIGDSTCYESFVRIFETYCGSLSHGFKHAVAIANICNEGVTKEQMAEVSAQACPTFPSNPWSSIERGFSL